MEDYFYEEMYDALYSYIIRNCDVAEIESITARQLLEFPLLDRSYTKFKEEWTSYQ